VGAEGENSCPYRKSMPVRVTLLAELRRLRKIERTSQISKYNRLTPSKSMAVRPKISTPLTQNSADERYPEPVTSISTSHALSLFLNDPSLRCLPIYFSIFQVTIFQATSPTKFCMHLVPLPYEMCHTRHALSYFTIRISDDLHKYTVPCCLISPFTSSFLNPNIFLSTTFSTTRIFGSSVRVRRPQNKSKFSDRSRDPSCLPYKNSFCPHYPPGSTILSSYAANRTGGHTCICAYRTINPLCRLK
jgi:hypothetical protein